MRKLLYLILVLDVIGIAVGFFMALAQSILLAVLILASGILGLVPIYALITALDDIDSLRDELSRLRYDLRSRENQGHEESVSDAPITAPSAEKKEVAQRNWQCIKCVTINKAGTSKCSHCGTPYDPWLNPTD